MNPDQQQAVLTIALLAAFADGANDDREREQIRRLADSLGSQQGAPDLPALYQQVLLKQASLQDAAALLVDAGHRQLAYEMAVCVCDADGRVTEAERHAILNGALELLPQSWASMGIIPLQIKMVYGIGKAHGYELDQGHIRELLATLGVGLTSQYLEQFGRKLLGGLLGKAAGGIAKQFGKAATSVAFSFATTYALGQLSKRYYAGGRQMSSALLQETFQNLLGPAKQMQTEYLPQIQQKAGNLDLGQIMSMVRGG